MLPQTVLFLLCLPFVLSYVSPCSECRDEEGFCSLLTPQQCHLRIARMRCRRTCDSCYEDVVPELSSPGCVDDSPDCGSTFYVCGVYTEATKRCAKTCEVCTPKRPVREDPVVACMAKHDGELCNKLGAACAFVTRTSIPQFTTGPDYVLPPIIAQCMIKENIIAMCYAKYCMQRCNLWLGVCKIPSPYAEVTDEQAKCLKDQAILDSCVKKYDAKFCYSLVQTCTSMLGVTWTQGGSIYKLPANVLSCVTQEDVFAVCQVKHGLTFCTKLGQSCATLTKLTFPVIKAGQLVVLPTEISTCISHENYIAMLYVEFGSVKIEKWMTKCKITVWNGPVTVVQKECVEEQRNKPDPKALCIEKYGAEFCRKLEIACYRVRKIKFVESALCSICELPEVVAECIATEDYLAMYFARYEEQKVILWMTNCKITITAGPVTTVQQECLKKERQAPDVVAVCVKKYGTEFCLKLQTACFEVMRIPLVSGPNVVLPATVAICISSDNWMANCYARYGQKNCVMWRETCRSRYSRFDADLLDDEKDCIKSQTIIYKCVQKYNAKLCYKMVEVCCAMHDVPYSEGPVQKLPYQVLTCVKTEDVVVICRAKHGVMFCNKLGAACSKLTKVSIPEAITGAEYKLPDVIAVCIREENYIAMLMVEYGFVKIETWMTTCKITVWNGPITVVQKECIHQQTLLPDPRTVCIQKYGTDFCNKLITACFEIRNIPVIGDAPCSVCELPAVVNICLQEENYVAMCYSKYGAGLCITWMKTCRVRGADGITAEQITCMKKQHETYSVITVCTQKYGAVFCKKLRTACYEVMRVPVPFGNDDTVALPTSVSVCISSENWMANCYVNYGARYCMEWRRVCKSQLANELDDLSDEEIDCMKSQTVIFKCVVKHDAKFCYKIIEVCSAMYSIPYSEGPIQKLPAQVVTCLYSGDVMVLCKAKHGDIFCNKLASACSRLTHIKIPEFRLGVHYTLPEAVAGCISQENYVAVMMVEYGYTKIETWMTMCKITIAAGPITVIEKECIKKQSVLPDPRTVCIQKYGADFCTKLVVACYEVKHIHLVSNDQMCTVCELPALVTICVKEEDYVAMCYAKYGVARCNQWFIHCNVRDRYGLITAEQKACIKKQNELPDVITLCTRKHGAEYCQKLKLACFELMRVPVPVVATGGAVVALPQPITVCISSENWMARCYVKYGSQQCLIWREACRDQYTRCDEILSENEKECIKSQTIIFKCVQKYDAKFCYKIVAVCSEMYNVPYVEGPVQQLTERVISCLYSDDVIVLCRAKHGVAFCNKLASSCAVLTQVTIPSVVFGIEYKLPDVVAKCITDENYIAVLYIEYGQVKVKSWMQRCKITVWNGPVTVVQKECVEKLRIEPDPRTLCVEKYGDEFCEKLVRACYDLSRINIFMQPTCSVCLLPEPVAKCVQEEYFIAMCYAKYGVARCNLWLENCKVTITTGLITETQITCIKKQNEIPDAISLCLRKFPAEYCEKLRVACFEVMRLPIVVATQNGVAVLPSSVSVCITSENWMAKCYVKYGSKQCIEWREICMSRYSRVGSEITEDEKECIKSQTVIYKCVKKHDAKFCYKIIAVCCDMHSVPYTEGPVQKLPEQVVACLYSEDALVLCRARHGYEFCSKLVDACSRITKVVIPQCAGRLPFVVSKCVSEEYYIATLIVEYGFTKVETWTARCKITVFTGAITLVQKECIKKISVEPDPRVVCIEKYGTDFCVKLIKSCFDVYHIRMVGLTPCTACVLPEQIFTCIQQEDYVATCYAKYGVARCLAWMSECGVANVPSDRLTDENKACIKKQNEIPDPMTVCTKRYGVEFCNKMKAACYEIMRVAVVKPSADGVEILPKSIAICISSENWMAGCYVRYGSQQCNEWRQTCVRGDFICDGQLTEEEKECIKSQTIIFKCVQKYDAKFCYKILAVCSEMNSVPFSEGPVQFLPQRVVTCLYSEDVVVLCRAKHGVAFCDKLATACAQLTNTQVPAISIGAEYKLADALSKCISEESYIAVLIVEYGFVKIQTWMLTCKITVWNGPITVVQKECVKKQTLLPDPKTQCVEKYGAEFCDKLVVACFDLRRIHMTGYHPCSVCDLPPMVSHCIQSEDFVAMCYAKYGVPRCNKWLRTCLVYNRYGVITAEQKDCVNKQNKVPDAITLCIKKYGAMFCQKLKIACFEAMQIPMPSETDLKDLPSSILICIQSDNWIARCYVRYGSKLCREWRETCRDKYSKIDTEISPFEKECIKSQSVIYQCVQKYDANFCYKIIAVCASMYDVPYVEGPVQHLPQRVVTCLYSGDVVVLCRAKHGVTFCNNLASACSILTQTSLPQQSYRGEVALPEIVGKCIAEEHYVAKLIVEYGNVKVQSWVKRCKITVWNGPITVIQKQCIEKLSVEPDPRSVCAQKYGDDFCEKLVAACYRVSGVRIRKADSCAACVLPELVADCVSKEHYVAMCYAKYSPKQCESWMAHCNILFRPNYKLTPQNIECIKKRSELNDAMTLCKKKYGDKFCKKLRAACFDVMRVTAVVGGNDQVKLLPASVSICVLSDNYLARCYAKFGVKMCIKWRQTCMTEYSKPNGQITSDEKECIRSQRVIYKCVQKYDANFCYKILAVCCDMNSVPYSGNPVQRLPKKVVYCLNSEDVMVLCRAKHGFAFCAKLASACSKLTSVSIPRIKANSDVKLPDEVVDCMTKEHYIAVLIVEYGFVKVETWMTMCKITVWNGPITVIQKDCIKKQTLLPEPKTLCVEKYGADFCNKLVKACYQIKRLRMIGDSPCSVCELPAVINVCISKEDYIAMCYAKYGEARCNQWMRICEVESRYGEITPQQRECMKKQNELPDVMTLCKRKYGDDFCVQLRVACFDLMKLPVPVSVDDPQYLLPQSITVCIQSENWLARCFVRYGTRLCMSWRETCRDKYTKIDVELTESEKTCIESQTIIYKCVQKYDAKFCYKIIAVCAQMHSVPYTECAVQRLPQKVVRCLYSDDVVVLCRAKHGFEFCDKLALACSKLTKVQMPAITPGEDYKLPTVIANCISEEYYMAMLMVEYGYVKIETWMQLCKITVWNGPITVIQKECVKKQSLLPDPKTRCVEKYGDDFCDKLVIACFEVRKITVIQDSYCSVCEIPAVVSTCIAEENYVAMCYAKYGSAKCSAWMLACKVPDPFGVITDAQKACIKKQNEMPDVVTICVKKYGTEFCAKLKSACFEILKVPVVKVAPGGVEVLPMSISICIQSENFMAECYAKYGSRQCLLWRETCRDEYLKSDSELTENEKECIKSQTVIYKCVQKYDANFCYKIIAVCCDIYSIPYAEGPVQRLPERVITCLYSEDAFVLCRAKHGMAFCNKLGSACAVLTNTPLPEVTLGVDYKLPEIIAKCVLNEDYVAILFIEYGEVKVRKWMTTCKITVWNGPITVVQKECVKKLSVEPDPKTVCIQKYGAEFCNKLVVACYGLRKLRLVGDSPCTICLLPDPVALCLSSEDYVAMCYAKFGEARCNAWMLECSVMDRYRPLTDEQKACIKRQNEMPDPITICKKKYGVDFCIKLRSACFEVMKVKFVEMVPGTVQVLPRSVSVCISSDNYMANCFARYGSEKCLKWREICRSKYSRSDIDLTDEEKECIKSQTMQVQCISKYGEKFCNSMLSVCSSMLSIPFAAGPAQKLPPGVHTCAGSADPVLICRAKHCNAFCNRLGAACSKVMNIPIPQFSGSGEYKLPNSIAVCIKEENPVAMCFANHCPQKCQSWMMACNIRSDISQLSSEQITCFEKQEGIAELKQKCASNPLDSACQSVASCGPPPTCSGGSIPMIEISQRVINGRVFYEKLVSEVSSVQQVKMTVVKSKQVVVPAA